MTAHLGEGGQHEARGGAVAGRQALQAVHLRDAARHLVAHQRRHELPVRLLALCRSASQGFKIPRSPREAECNAFQTKSAEHI